MNLFIAQIQNNEAILNEEESHHLYRVLRLNRGDEVLVTNGEGLLYNGEITEIQKKQVNINLISEVNPGLVVPSLNIAFAPTKSNDRSETLIEKAVELGARNIYPIITHHSERRKINRIRWQKIADAAMKQSLKSFRCQVHELQKFENFISLKKFLGDKFIAHCDKQFETIPLTSIIKSGKSNLILIGPEGDFSPQEISLSIKHEFKSVTFGDQRLRTETAGIFFSAIHNFVNQ